MNDPIVALLIHKIRLAVAETFRPHHNPAADTQLFLLLGELEDALRWTESPAIRGTNGIKGPPGPIGPHGVRGTDGIRGPDGIRCDTTVLDALIAEYAIKRAAFEARSSLWRRMFRRR